MQFWRGRIESSSGNNHLNLSSATAEVVDYSYDFADNVTLRSRSHQAAGPSLAILEEMHYDHAGRLTDNYHQFNGGTKVHISNLAYTVKDELMEKNLGGTGASFLQSLDYAYYSNGFLSSINGYQLGGANTALTACPPALPNPGAASPGPDLNDLFYLSLKYNNPDGTAALNAPAQKNGNISQVVWRVRGRERQTYGLSYDFLNRLESATYAEYYDWGGINVNNRFSASYSYDARGNIAGLSRQGMYWDGACWQQGQVDNLSYAYYNTAGPSNQLAAVSDSAPAASKGEGYRQSNADTYKYDPNGNLTDDPQKGLAIAYNYLNLPEKIEAGECQFMEWLYDAAGNKLQKALKKGEQAVSTHSYAGGIEYRNGVVEAIYHAEGRLYFEGALARYEYNIADHLGNTRLTFTDKNGNGRVDVTNEPASNEILEENHYYPFGLQLNGPWSRNAGRENKYLFNGIERNDDLGLNWDLATFRSYDASIGRWMQVDPKYNERLSPYSGFGNNPLILTDPLGDTTYVYSSLDQNGKPIYSDSELGAITLAAAIIDAENGLESHYVITTHTAIEKGQHTLDKDTDLVYEITDSYNGDGPGLTWNFERDKGQGFQSGVINPDHRSLSNRGSRPQQLFNAGVALSHEQNTHGFSNKIDLIGGGNTLADDHVYDKFVLDTGRPMPFYTGPIGARYNLMPEHTLSGLNKNKAQLILEREKIKNGIHSGKLSVLGLIANTKKIHKAINR